MRDHSPAGKQYEHGRGEGRERVIPTLDDVDALLPPYDMSVYDSLPLLQNGSPMCIVVVVA